VAYSSGPREGEAARASRRALVRRGYDAISQAYRTDDGAAHPSTDEDPGRYLDWVAELAALLPGRARVVDLGCGAGVPGTLALTRHGMAVLGVDFSAVQLARARRRAARLTPVWHRHIPEGNVGHTLILATAS
jgi:cyclopropane fatty-acyl-phospholipid synthase-like methyltransferase